MVRRYALYYAPPEGSALDRLGKDWLDGRVSVPGIAPDRVADLTAVPRVYGFHGTLKPPFVLRDGGQEEGLLRAVRLFNAGHTAFPLPPLRVRALGRFLALVPETDSPALAALASDCVRAFDSFRAPPSEAELARRRAKSLTQRQEDNLAAWGYPYVMDDFRFHLTLTGPLEEAEERDTLATALAPLFEPLCAGLAVEGVTVFVQDAAGERFRRG